MMLHLLDSKISVRNCLARLQEGRREGKDSFTSGKAKKKPAVPLSHVFWGVFCPRRTPCTLCFCRYKTNKTNPPSCLRGGTKSRPWTCFQRACLGLDPSPFPRLSVNSGSAAGTHFRHINAICWAAATLGSRLSPAPGSPFTVGAPEPASPEGSDWNNPGTLSPLGNTGGICVCEYIRCISTQHGASSCQEKSRLPGRGQGSCSPLCSVRRGAEL